MGSHLCHRAELPSHPAPKMELFQGSVQEKKRKFMKCVWPCFPFPQLPLPTLIYLKTLKRLIENTAEWVI